MTGDQLVTIAVQLLITAAGGGILVKLLTLRQDRRRIVGDATKAEANAATTLTGGALELVESVRQDVRDARTELRATKAESETLRGECGQLRQQLFEARRDADELRLRIRSLESREEDLERILVDAGLPIPPRRRAYDERPGRPPTVEAPTAPDEEEPIGP